jgi:hypothetical protein
MLEVGFESLGLEGEALEASRCVLGTVDGFREL